MQDLRPRAGAETSFRQLTSLSGPQLPQRSKADCDSCSAGSAETKETVCAKGLAHHPGSSVQKRLAVSVSHHPCTQRVVSGSWRRRSGCLFWRLACCVPCLSSPVKEVPPIAKIRERSCAAQSRCSRSPIPHGGNYQKQNGPVVSAESAQKPWPGSSPNYDVFSGTLLIYSFLGVPWWPSC